MEIQTTSGVVVIEPQKETVNYDSAVVPIAGSIFLLTVILYIVHTIFKRKTATD